MRSAGADAAAGESKPTTDPSRLNMAERGIRAAGQNALEVSIGVFGDGLNNILVRALLTAAGPTESCFRQQAHELRSSSASTKWLSSQISGAFLCHCCETLEELTSHSTIEFCRFQTAMTKAKSTDEHETQGQLILQDELAGMFGRLATGLAPLRLKR